MVIQLRLAPVYSAEMRKLQWNQSATYFMEYPVPRKVSILYYSVYYAWYYETPCTKVSQYIMPGDL